MRSLLVLIVAVLIVSGCNSGGKDGNVLKIADWNKSKATFNDMLFINEKIGYLFGETAGDVIWYKDGEAKRADTAKIYSTKNGGETWSIYSLGKGVVRSGFFLNKNVYAVKYVNDSIGESLIYKLNVKNNQWEKFSLIKGYLKQLGAGNNGQMFALVKPAGLEQYLLYETNKSDTTWRALDGLSRIDQLIIKQNQIAYLSVEKNDSMPFSTLLVKFNPETKKTIVMPLPAGFRAYCFTEYNSEFYFLGTLRDAVVLYILNSKGQFNQIKQFYTGTRIYPEKLNVFGNKVVVVIGERKSLYVTKHLYDSGDKGRSWKERGLWNPSYANPVCFFNEVERKTFLTWIYCGSGEIQFIKGGE